MKHTTQRERADEEVEKIKRALKLTGLDYFIEESPINIKKTYIQDFSPPAVRRLNMAAKHFDIITNYQVVIENTRPGLCERQRSSV